MRKSRRNVEYLSLEEVLGFEPDYEEPSKRIFGLNTLKAMLGIGFIAFVMAGFALPVVGSAGIAAREAANYWTDLPETLPPTTLPQRSIILASDGSKIADFFSENRVIVKLADVPQVMRDAVLSIEDSRFYEHNGVDIKGTGRAALNNFQGGDTQGGSTLTQQYVKNVLLQTARSGEDRDEVAGRSYLRKLKEARLALATEKTLTKDQILEGYFNIAYFGDGAYGIGTAAQHYFGKTPNDLTLAEAALLAGLVKNPTGLNPVKNPDAAVARRNIVLQRMADLGKVPQIKATEAKMTPLTLTITDPPNGCTTSPYPFYCQWVKETLQNDPAFGDSPEAREERLFKGGMVIKTSLDPKAQASAEAAVARGISKKSRVAVASVTVQPGTGHVVSMAVNRDFGKGEGRTELLLPTLPAYQPGSTMKPFALAVALEQGFPLGTVMSAPARYTPRNMNAPDGGFGNAGDSAAGTYNAAQATWRSVNTWYIKLEEQTGVLALADMSKRLGITSLPREGDRAITSRDGSLVLGAYEVSPLEMAGAYAAFAAHGKACRPVGILEVTGPGGVPYPTPDPRCHQAVAPGVADTITSILQGVIDGPDEARTGKAMTLGRPAAGKTGTTNGSAAVWFAGYTPQYATAVWVGDPRGGPRYPLRGIWANGRAHANAYGGTVAGPIWKNVMAPLHAGVPVQGFRPPDPNILNGYGNITPDVRGLDRDKAIQVLQDAGFTVKVSKDTARPDPLMSPNRVASTDPAAGTRIPYAGTITLTLTDKSNTNVIIPDPHAKPAPEPQVNAPGTGGVVTPNDPALQAAGDRSAKAKGDDPQALSR